MIDIQLFPEQSEWDKYVSQSDQSSFSHLYGWGDTLASIYDLRIFRLAARKRESNGKILGVLPLIFFTAPGFDKRCISLPYSDAAGIIADEIDIYKHLLLAALELADGLEAVHLELRQAGNLILPHIDLASINHTAHTFKVALIRSLPESVTTLWQGIGTKVRNQVRKARKSGCGVIVGGAELLDQFYAVFSENMRDLGSPVHDRLLFDRMVCQLPEQLRIFVVTIGDIPAAAAIVFLHNNTLYNPWASSLRRFRPDCPNMLLYWSMLAYGVEKKCRRFDFGRSSPNASTCHFKLQWGAKMQPLTWHVFSQEPHQWRPECETLVDAQLKDLPLEASRRGGPSARRWISL